MRAVLHGAALLVAVCCLTWLAVLWRWQATARQVTPADFGLYLVLLPALVFGFVLALRWAWRGAAERQAARDTERQAAAQAHAAAPGKGAAGAANTDEAERHVSVQLLGAAVNSAAAAAPSALLAAGYARQPLPKVDAELRNAEGLPVMSARIADLDPGVITEALNALPRGASKVHNAGHAIPAVGGGSPGEPEADTEADPGELPPQADHLLRALAALAPPLAQALQALQPWHDQLAGPQAPSRLQVLAAWPAAWTDTERRLATAWLHQQLTTSPDLALAADRMQLDAAARGAVELWTDADRWFAQQRRERRRDLLLLAACHSDLSDEAIATLEIQQRLFIAGKQPRGRMPNEAAAALVLAPSDWPAAGEPPPEPPVWLHRPAALRRDKPIEAAGSVSSQVLGVVLEGALTLAKLPAADVAAVVCDADQHTPRGTELFGLTLKMLPHLDAAEQLCLTGGVAGHGEAGALMVVAAAAAQVRTEGKPCLALALGDSHWRLGLLLRATAPAPAEGPAGTAPAGKTDKSHKSRKAA